MKKFIAIGVLLFLVFTTEGFARFGHGGERLVDKRRRELEVSAQRNKDQINTVITCFFSVVGAVAFGLAVKEIDDAYSRRRRQKNS